MQRALLIALVVASYLLFAGAPDWATLPLVAIALVAALWNPRRTFALPRALRPLDLALIAAAAALLVQLIPLPPSLVDWLSPHASPVRATVGLMALAGAPAAAHPLTLDTNATAHALGILVIAILTYWVARAAFSTSGGVRQYCRLLAGLGAMAAMVGAVQRAVEPTMLLGVTRVSGPGLPFGAFVNRNHFAAWLLMILALSGGYLVAHVRIHISGRRGWRNQVREILNSGGLLTAASLFVILVVLLLTLSRSALIGLGVTGLTSWLLARGRLEFDRRGWLFIAAVIGLAAIFGATFIDLDGWADRLGNTFTETSRPQNRLVIWRESLPMIRDFWLTGTGAGAYGIGMLVYQQSRIWIPHLAGWAYFNQAHSHYLQVAAEGGLLLGIPVLAGLVALAVLGWKAVNRDRGEMFWVRVGAASGLAGIAAQSVWETALRMPANAVVCATLVAVLLHDRHERSH